MVQRKEYSSFSRWVLGGLLCSLVHGVGGFYLLYHVGVGIPLAYLWKPYVIISVLTISMFAGICWAAKGPENNRTKRRFIVLGAYMCSTAAIGVHYAAQAGVIADEDAVPFSIVMTIGVAMSMVIAYRLRKSREGNESDKQ